MPIKKEEILYSNNKYRLIKYWWEGRGFDEDSCTTYYMGFSKILFLWIPIFKCGDVEEYDAQIMFIEAIS